MPLPLVKVTQMEFDAKIDARKRYSKAKPGLRRETDRLYGDDFARRDCSGLDFKGADLLRACFVSSILKNCDLKGVNFTGAGLGGVDFKDANVEGANFTDANLTEANFTGANAKKVNFTDADLRKADFTGADLRGANLDGEIYGIKGIDFLTY